MLLYQLPQVDVHLLRVLVDEAEALLLGLLLVHNLRALQDERHVLVPAPDFAQQLQSGLWVTLLHVGQPPVDTLHGESRVGDDAQHVVVIHLIPVHGLLVGSGQHHLGSPALALCGSMGVQRLGGEVLRLRQDVVIQVGQHGGVEPDIVFHQHNHLHTRLLDVVLDVHLVFYELDDAQDEVGVAQPAEHVVEDGHVLVLYALGDAVREGCQHHTRHVGSHHLHVARYGEGVVVGIARHADHQVDVGGLQHAAGLFRC